jgi:hypothetical protein
MAGTIIEAPEIFMKQPVMKKDMILNTCKAMNMTL